jgi:exopolyphosphatase / guanosine-5'-triphosphate,3'-diphosphate pyrophosphatase
MTEHAARPLHGIVPRWEWRTFGDSFGDAERAFAARSPERVEDSDDLYLLSRRSDASVKVRNGLMDVKELLDVDADGLEQWAPVLKAAFPLPAADVASVLTTLGVPVPDLDRDAYSLEELIDGFVEPSPDLRAVDVRKRREHHTIGGCRAELSEMRTGSGATRTIAIESEDAGQVSAAVRALGLEGRPVVCVARGLKALVGWGARRYAVIDVGTNSVKFHIGERAADGTWRTIVDRAEVTRLGEGLDATGRLGAEPVQRTAAAVAGMVDEAHRAGTEAIAAVGTAALRIAPNASDLTDAVRARTGLRVEVVPGEEETRLAYLAVKTDLGLAAGSLVVFDTGGGSSQFTFGRGERIDERFSVNVGAARFTERFGLDRAVDEETLARAFDAIGADLARLDGRPAPDTVVGMGGAVTNLTAVKHGLATYDPDVVQGTVLTRDEIERQIELYRTRGADERRAIVGLQPARAEVILAGACIVRTVLAKLGRDALTVSDRALRHGLLYERFGSAA